MEIMIIKKNWAFVFLLKTALITALATIPSMADAIYCLPRATADSLRENLKVGQRMMYFCSPHSELYFNLEDAFRLESFSADNACDYNPDHVEIKVNQQILPLQCLYLEKDGVFTHFLNLYENPEGQKSYYIHFFDTLGRALEKRDGVLLPFDWRARYLKRKDFNDNALGQVGAYFSQEDKIKKVRLLHETREYFSLDSALVRLEAIQKAAFFGDSIWTTGKLLKVFRECRKASRLDPFAACDRECLYVAEYELEKPLPEYGSLIYGEPEIHQFTPSGEIKNFAPKNILNHIKPRQPVPYLNRENIARGKAFETVWHQRGDSILYSANPDSKGKPKVSGVLNLRSNNSKCYSYGDILVLQDFSDRGFLAHVFYQGTLILSHAGGDSPPQLGHVMTYETELGGSKNLLFSYAPHFRQTYTILMTRQGSDWSHQKSVSVDFECGPC